MMEPFPDTPAIQAKILQRILDACAIADAERSELLASENLDAAALSEIGAMVPLHAYLRIFDRLALALRRPALGLQLSALFGPELIGAIGYLFLNSSTLTAALAAYSESVFSIQGVTELTFVPGTRSMVAYAITDDSMRPRRQDVEFSLGHVHALIRRYLGPNYAPLEVHFEHPLVGRLATYDLAFGCPVHFEQPRNALFLREEDLKRASPAADTGLAAILRHYLQLVDYRDRGLGTWAERVRDLILVNAETERVQVQQVAGRLGLGVYALQRRLRAEGTSLRALALSKRMTVAQRYLLETELSVLAIANLLGYTETASFTRAFKAYVGANPSQFRKRNR